MEELLPYLSQDSVEVVMKPGTYRVTVEDIKAGRYQSCVEITKGRKCYSILLVSGNGSVYDFSDVVLEVETGVFNAYEGGYDDFFELHMLGNNNVVKNLKLVDIGKALDYPKYGACNVVIDGANNCVDGVQVYSVGSFPYGYGELFGKGGPRTIRHWKHSACLVRGFRSHVLNCRIIHRAYGHCLFMQAADEPLIEGCYIEGEMTTTDKVLEEEGTGTRADRIDFKTVWGYRVPAGFTISTVEAGIRVYNVGNTMIDGVRYSRGTSNVRVKDCYVKNVRAGITLTHTKGYRVAENCTTIGCERGFAVGTNGKIINCKSDTQYGAAFGVDYERDANIEVDITLLPNMGEPLSGNGSKQAAYLVGRDHKIRFRKGEGLDAPEQDLVICVGGDNTCDSSLGRDENYSATNIELINETSYPIVLDAKASNITGSTRGTVADRGANNQIKIVK